MTEATSKPTGPKHNYKDWPGYEDKLVRVMNRLGAKLIDYDYTGRTRAKRGELSPEKRPQKAEISFTRGGKFYFLQHTPEQSARGSVPVRLGGDLFAQLVNALEMIARLSEWGLSQLNTESMLSGAQALVPAELPEWCKTLGLESLPNDEAEVVRAYRHRIRETHPDAPGGSAAAFQAVQLAYEHGLAYIARRSARIG